MAYVGINDKSHLIALRFCLGLIEAGYFVRRDELLTVLTNPLINN